MTVLLAYVHPGFYPDEFAQSVDRVRQDPEIEVARLKVGGGMIAGARNDLANYFLNDTDADYLWWVDSDMVFGHDTLRALLAADRPIVCALYMGIHGNGQTFPVAVLKDGNALRRATLEDVPDEEFWKVFGTGMGCALIQRRVYEKLGVRPRKLWPYEECTLYGDRADQDVVFCHRAGGAGFPTVIQVGNRVGHIKSVVI